MLKRIVLRRMETGDVRMNLALSILLRLERSDFKSEISSSVEPTSYRKYFQLVLKLWRIP